MVRRRRYFFRRVLALSFGLILILMIYLVLGITGTQAKF